MPDALALLFPPDPEVTRIVGLSLRVSASATLLAAAFALPAGAALALLRFPGRPLVVTLLNAGMGLPPVVVGLVVYLALSRAGPLGEYGLLFTPTAMVFAQALLVAPILAALTRQTIEGLADEYGEELRSLGAGPLRAVPTLLWDGRIALGTALLAGFGRAIAEVGAVIIVGGNIAGVTRVMTTTIALETSRGNFELALGLGVVLATLSFGVNALAVAAQSMARRAEGLTR